MAIATETCRYCGSDKLFTVRCEAGSPHYARTGCSSCGRFLRWEAAPLTIERAKAFVMPFGKWAGRPLPDVPREYLRWMVDNGIGRDSTRRVVEFWLQHGEARDS